MTVPLPLDPEQRDWLRERLPDAVLVRDMSWRLMASTVLRVRSGGADYVVKAGGPENHHIGREIAAHPRRTAALTSSGHAARMLDADPDLRVMLLEHLPGVLVEGTPAEWRPDTYVQAGDLLRRLHAQETREDPDHERIATDRALGWLDQPHRVDPDAERAARRILERAETPSVRVVPAHGDWQPRNWLISPDAEAGDGVIRVIDFGRFAFRPANSDLGRLAGQQWRGRPDLERAFFDGYGEDPRDPVLWPLHLLREAVGTACWAFKVGDTAFEQQGHRLLSEALARF
ncbi:aminoglycoside phosphotransferase family protein [Microbacterium sp.]|uniref:aminoglycoside phosphotransferase family protein n=1 Tax=Microbacterium sp. TaxID=51671 RepID=UPI00333FE30E